MSDTTKSEVLTARVTPAELVRIDIAARVHGQTRHRYAGDAAIERAERDLERLAGRAADRNTERGCGTRG